MKKTIFISVILLTFCTFFACKNATPTDSAVENFKKCGATNCVKETVALKDAFLKNPKGILDEFTAIAAKGEDHLIGWLYCLRDSVLTNPAKGDLTSRIAMRDALVKAAKEFETDPKLKDVAQAISSHLEEIAMLAETEDGEENDPLEPLNQALTGTYAYELPNDSGDGTVQISQLTYNKFKFELFVRGAPPALNTGGMSGETTFSGGKAVYKTTEFGDCQLEFTFDKDLLTIKTLKGEPFSCGFGNAIMADGKYKRNNYADPFLSKNTAKMAADLNGEWQSATDPKAGVTIKNGQFSLSHDGKMDAPLAYVFGATCSSGCDVKGKFPCISVFGQDNVCYAVVKADGKTLELSQVGGKGNTNKYVRKK